MACFLFYILYYVALYLYLSISSFFTPRRLIFPFKSKNTKLLLINHLLRQCKIYLITKYKIIKNCPSPSYCRTEISPRQANLDRNQNVSFPISITRFHFKPSFFIVTKITAFVSFFKPSYVISYVEQHNARFCKKKTNYTY